MRTFFGLIISEKNIVEIISYFSMVTNFFKNILNTIIFYILEFLIDYLKQDADKQYFCDADIIVRNKTDFDPKTVCGENAFLPLILEWQHIRHLSLILQLLDLEL